MAGLACWGRAQLYRHPSFWAEEEAEQLPNQVVEDPRICNAERNVYNAIASQVTPFVASLDEHSVNVGPLAASAGPSRDVFKRCLSMSYGNTSGYGWRDRHRAYLDCNKLNLGTERVICSLEPEGCERRLTQRLMISRLEATPSLVARGSGGNSLFEAFCQAVWGAPPFHPLLRQLVVKYMREDLEARGEYAAALGDDYDAYLDWMSRLGVAGDELVLRALADRFGIPITVVTGDEVIWCVRYPPRVTTSQREVFLAVVPTARFSAVRRQSAIASIRMTFSNSPEQKFVREQRKKMII